MSAQSPKAKMQRLVEQKPLSHPGVWAMYARDYEYAPPEHLRKIYGRVFKAITNDGWLKKFCELKPREHGKSEGGTVDNVSWLIMRDPTSRVLIMSEGSDLAENKLEQVSELVKQYGPQFGVEISQDNNAALELEHDANHGQATVEAAGFGSKVTGGHYDLIIFDDLVDWPSQRTEARRNKIWQQFQNYLNLGSEGETVFLVLGTRKHPEDLYSQLLENSAWYTTVDAAIRDWSIVEDGEYTLITENPDTGVERRYAADEAAQIPRSEAIKDAEPHREVEVLWPERWPLNKLLVDMHAGFGADEGNLVWKRENQNAADALQGQILSEDMLMFSEDLDYEVDESQCTVHYGLDPAVEDDPEAAATNDTDYWALAEILLDRRQSHDRAYVSNVWRKRGMTLSKGVTWVKSKIGLDHSGTLAVEDQQAQRWFVKTARDRGLNARGTSSSGESKEDRIISMSSRFEDGRVVLLGGPDDWTSFINEWCAFPTAAHDDRLDGVEIGLRGADGQNSYFSDYDMGDLPT